MRSRKHVEEKNITLPVLVDDSGIFFYYCNVSGYPTTFVISQDGYFVVYVPGAMNLEGFNSLLEYAKQNSNQE